MSETLLAIQQQAKTMEQQRDDALATGRARIEIKSTLSLIVERNDPYWYLVTGIDVRNIGNSRAFILRTAAKFFVVENTEDINIEDPSLSSLAIEDDILDPTKHSIPIDIHHFPDAEGFESVEKFADRFYESRVNLVILGWIEYETMGTKWHRGFGFIRRGSGGSFLEELSGRTPDTPEHKISSGWWEQYGSHYNEEYEIDQNPN